MPVWIKLICCIATCATCVMLLAAPRNEGATLKTEQFSYAGYSKIKRGDSHKDVINLLGKPFRTYEDSDLGINTGGNIELQYTISGWHWTESYKTVVVVLDRSGSVVDKGNVWVDE